jgi:hypothetical protein
MCLARKKSSKMRRSPTHRRVAAWKALSKSSAARTPRDSSFTLNAGAAASAALNCGGVIGLAEFQRMATRETLGTTSTRSCSLFAAMSGSWRLSPVMFPPSRAKLETSPDPTGSATSVITTGNRGGCLLGSQVRRRSLSRDYVHLEVDQLGREGKEPFGLTLRVAVLDDDVLAFRVANLEDPAETPRARGGNQKERRRLEILPQGPSPAAASRRRTARRGAPHPCQRGTCGGRSLDPAGAHLQVRDEKIRDTRDLAQPHGEPSSNFRKATSSNAAIPRSRACRRSTARRRLRSRRQAVEQAIWRAPELDHLTDGGSRGGYHSACTRSPRGKDAGQGCL